MHVCMYACCKVIAYILDMYLISMNEASIHKAAKEFSINRKQVQEWYNELNR